MNVYIENHLFVFVLLFFGQVNPLFPPRARRLSNIALTCRAAVFIKMRGARNLKKIMRLICNLLIGLPIAGLITGSVLLLVQTMLQAEQSLNEWNVFGVFLQWLLVVIPGADELVRPDFMRELPMGAHLMLLSALGAPIMLPLGLVLYRFNR
jgi:hypothetical protein